MSKTLKDFFDDYFDQAWLWCDIDGDPNGPDWKLVIPHEDEKENLMIKFPNDNFEDYAENYLDYPAREIVKPAHPQDID